MRRDAVVEQIELNPLGEFRMGCDAYGMDIKDQTISVYRATVRGVNNEWCDENPIYGKETRHVQGFSRHYHLQFPFVRKDRFHQVFGDYEALRRRQIQELTDAL